MQKVSYFHIERCTTVEVRCPSKFWDAAEAVARDRHVPSAVQAPLLRHRSERVDALSMHQRQFFTAPSTSVYNFFGRLFKTTSGSSVALKRFCSSSSRSQPRRMPFAFLNTPLRLASASGLSLKITGKSTTSGRSPGMPDVRATGNCNHSSLSASPLSPLKRASPSCLGLSKAVVHSKRCLFSFAKAMAHSCCACAEGYRKGCTYAAVLKGARFTLSWFSGLDDMILQRRFLSALHSSHSSTCRSTHFFLPGPSSSCSHFAAKVLHTSSPQSTLFVVGFQELDSSLAGHA